MKAAAPGETKRKDRMKTIKDQLKAGRVDEPVADLKPHLRFEAVATCIRTYETNKDPMRCGLWGRGLPIDSGVVESACKKIVGSRFKRAGHHGSKAGADALLAANAAWKTTAGAKSSIGGIAAPQSIDQETRDAAGSPKILEPCVAKDMEFGSLVGAFSQGA